MIGNNHSCCSAALAVNMTRLRRNSQKVNPLLIERQVNAVRKMASALPGAKAKVMIEKVTQKKGRGKQGEKDSRHRNLA